MLRLGKKVQWYCDRIECGHSWWATPNNVHSNKQSCPYCCPSSRALCADEDCISCYRRSLASDERARRLYSDKNLLPPRLVVLQSHIKVLWHCNECQHDWHAEPHNVHGGKQGCPYCYASSSRLCVDDYCTFCRRRSLCNDWRVERLYSNKNALRPRQVLLNSTIKVLWKCVRADCGQEWRASPNNVHGKGSDCPRCCLFVAERTVCNRFATSNVEFVFQWKQEWCKNKLPLPFDFCISCTAMSQVPFVLEVDGLHHFMPLQPSWRQTFLEQRARDIHKMRCLLAKGAPMVRMLSKTIASSHDEWHEWLVRVCETHLRGRIIVLQDNPLYHEWYEECLSNEIELAQFIAWA